jgi:formyltetrahydrofolate deformylase
MHCADRTGLVASVTEFIFKNNGNILDLEQHVDQEAGVFFMRAEWDLRDFAIPTEKIGEFFQVLIAERYGMTWSLHLPGQRPRMAIFVSRRAHCLHDLLARVQSDEWAVDVPVIISNHPDLQPVAERFGIDYQWLPISRDTKAEQEARALALLADYQIDFIVLARYMQILSADFVDRYPQRIINIHHSFLPAFPGARPYHSAYTRGVKIIGATCHYVTSELDGGPIIEQDVAGVSHKDNVADLMRRGRDLETIVLSRGVWKHLQHKVLVYDNRTVVFD